MTTRPTLSEIKIARSELVVLGFVEAHPHPDPRGERIWQLTSLQNQRDRFLEAPPEERAGPSHARIPAALHGDNGAVRQRHGVPPRLGTLARVDGGGPCPPPGGGGMSRLLPCSPVAHIGRNASPTALQE
jgi:hypothetical protein